MRFDEMETYAECSLQLTWRGLPGKPGRVFPFFSFLLSTGTEAFLSLATSLWILSFSRSFMYYS